MLEISQRKEKNLPMCYIRLIKGREYKCSGELSVAIPPNVARKRTEEAMLKQRVPWWRLEEPQSSNFLSTSQCVSSVCNDPLTRRKCLVNTLICSCQKRLQGNVHNLLALQGVQSLVG